jgi:carboxypeptidase Taq
MPKGGRAQRDKMIATVESVTGNALATTAERLPETPDNGRDPVSKSAWHYVAQKNRNRCRLLPAQVLLTPICSWPSTRAAICIKRSKSWNGSRTRMPCPMQRLPPQRRVVQRLMKALGLEDNHIRLGESAHPFTCGQWDDVRITARYSEKNMMPALMAIIHETGHALYSRALPKNWKDQPIGEPQSVWVHESQSLFWQNQVASGRDFMTFLSPILKDELGVDGLAWSPENLYRLVTRVKPGLIRTEADEVTYPAHVILRHDLERKLIDGTLAPRDVPEAWGMGMRELLDVGVPDDAHGCMQDVHWPQGIIGYFPAYSFGALGAAQLMEKLKQDMPNISDHVRNGDFAPIRAWMTDRVHQYGSRYTGEELMNNATGKPLSAEAWLNHVQGRYLG